MAPKIIVIDPGHGGSDPGAMGNGLVEKTLNLAIAKKVVNYLEHYDADIHLTRSDDRYLSLNERSDFANRLNADYFLSVHINAGGGTGFESYVHTSENPGTVELRRIIHNHIMDYLSPRGIRDRGLKSANFAVLRQTVMPAMLMECLFIDNPNDAKILKDEGFLNIFAKATAEGVAKALALSPKGQVDYDPMAEIEKLSRAGLINSPHLPSDLLTWGEFATVINRLLEKIKK